MPPIDARRVRRRSRSLRVTSAPSAAARMDAPGAARLLQPATERSLTRTARQRRRHAPSVHELAIGVQVLELGLALECLANPKAVTPQLPGNVPLRRRHR